MAPDIYAIISYFLGLGRLVRQFKATPLPLNYFVGTRAFVYTGGYLSLLRVQHYWYNRYLLYVYPPTKITNKTRNIKDGVALD